jgi:hypothetical protein
VVEERSCPQPQTRVSFEEILRRLVREALFHEIQRRGERGLPISLNHFRRADISADIGTRARARPCRQPLISAPEIVQDIGTKAEPPCIICTTITISRSLAVLNEAAVQPLTQLS